MGITLANFQLKAIEALMEAMGEPNRDIILKSCTGSGKTIILTHFMDEYLKSTNKAVFVWLTPGKGNLELQSKAKMDKYIHGSNTKLLSDIMSSGFEENDACFINWEKLTMTSPQVGEKLLTAEKIGLDGGDSRNQVLRYIRLTYLIPELLSMVDDGKIAFNPAVELSYLDSYQQRAVLDAMALNDCTPSHAQSIRLKKLAQEGVLDDQIVYAELAETKPNQQEQLKFKREELRKYFPSGYTEEQMRRDIIKGLELLKRQRERNRDAR